MFELLGHLPLEQVIEDHLVGADGGSVWVRVSLGPLAERGEPRAMAYAVFISRPDVETVDHEEVRRLRKSLELLAETHSDYPRRLHQATEPASRAAPRRGRMPELQPALVAYAARSAVVACAGHALRRA